MKWLASCVPEARLPIGKELRQGRKYFWEYSTNWGEDNPSIFSAESSTACHWWIAQLYIEYYGHGGKILGIVHAKMKETGLLTLSPEDSCRLTVSWSPLLLRQIMNMHLFFILPINAQRSPGSNWFELDQPGSVSKLPHLSVVSAAY